jgi:hypothetical protein
MLIQALLSKAAVKALNESVIRRFPGPGEIKLHASGLSPEKIIAAPLSSRMQAGCPHRFTRRFSVSITL